MEFGYIVDEWNIVEKGFFPSNHKKSESIFSLGNGKFGQRANFEEAYSGSSMQGTYIAGVYYPDKTKVGWWKNGYPEYFAKVLNAPYWTGIGVAVNGEELDIAKCGTEDFTRKLDMKEGTLSRSFIAVMPSGAKIKIEAERFISIADDELAAIKYSLTPLSCGCKIELRSYLNADVSNEDSNYGEQFWVNKSAEHKEGISCLLTETKKTGFYAGTGMLNKTLYLGQELHGEISKKEAFITEDFNVAAAQGQTLCLYKYVSVCSSLFHEPEKITSAVSAKLRKASQDGYQAMRDAHTGAWAAKWEKCDIVIGGDPAAQQGIRYAIFHMLQTYTGSDDRLNIGPKGFTGEKYGGSTYWDTEAFCLPFYMYTAGQEVAMHLLRYRHKQLGKAIENAEKLGFTGGAALYPMVTMNGEECHNEWEITFEEIHRNGAIAYAIYNYANATGDTSYLYSQGLEVLAAIARFWAQRTSLSARTGQRVILGVTGPNEYENNVNNNWYTNYIAKWCLEYAAKSIEEAIANGEGCTSIDKISLAAGETDSWKEIASAMKLPADESLGIFVQDDGFLDKELKPATELPSGQRPINQHWSWDRILRSCYIKQADVVQGLYFFSSNFTKEQMGRNFDFYEQYTVHESSLSASIYSVVASRTGRAEKAYQLYLRTARLDLDDYNKEASEGLHITSMAGTWLAVVEGFGGMQVKDGAAWFSPSLPKEWESMSFRVIFRGAELKLELTKDKVAVFNLKGPSVLVNIHGQCRNLPEGGVLEA
jgi:maltose phosphorylase